MVSDNKFKCLKFGLFGIVDGMNKRYMKRINILLYTSWICVLLGLILKRIYPEYSVVINSTFLFNILILLLIYPLLFLLGSKDRETDIRNLDSYFKAMENFSEEFLIEELHRQDISIDKIDNLIEDMKREGKDE